MLNFENLDKANFLGVGKYDTPIIQPEHIDVRHLEWIPFNFAKTCTDCATKVYLATTEAFSAVAIFIRKNSEALLF